VCMCVCACVCGKEVREHPSGRRGGSVRRRKIVNP
jgi:hypothetical protein